MSNLADIKLNEVGTYTATIKIAAVEPSTSGKAGFIVVEGLQKKLKYITSRSDKFAKKLEVGAESEATIEVVNEEYPQGSGNFSMVAFIRSFGGQTAQARGGYSGASKTFTPKTDAEIHSPSIAGLVKGCLEKSDKPADFDSWFQVALKGYMEGIAAVSGKASAVKASPQEAVVLNLQPGGQPDEKEALERIRALKQDAVDYWYHNGGDDEGLKFLKGLAKEASQEWHEVILAGARKDLKAREIVRGIEVDLFKGKAEPGDHRNSGSPRSSEKSSEVPDKDWYAEFNLVANRLGWPIGFAEAPDAYRNLCKRVLNRDVRKAQLLQSHDYWLLTQFALKCEAGTEEAPMGMAAYAKGKESASA